MELFFYGFIFLFILSALLSVAAMRAESRYSSLGSKAAYFAAAVLCGAALVVAAFSGELAKAGFFHGTLAAIALVAVVYAVLERRFASPFDPGVLSAVSIVLALIGAVKGGFNESAPSEASGHVLLMFLALAAFSLSFFFALAFLVQNFFLKTKKIGALFFRLPPLEHTARLNFLFLTLGAALMFAGAVSGVFLESGSVSLAEPTVWLTLLAIAMYAVVTVARIGPLERSRGIACATVIYYALVVITFAVAHAGFGGAS